MTFEEFLNGKVGRFGPCVNHEDGSMTTDPIRVPFQFRVLTDPGGVPNRVNLDGGEMGRR